jgi:hypothetical protein
MRAGDLRGKVRSTKYSPADQNLWTAYQTHAWKTNFQSFRLGTFDYKTS